MRALLAAAMLCVAASCISCAHAETARCYGNENHQVRTATGERYRPDGLTAEHLTLPFFSQLKRRERLRVMLNERSFKWNGKNSQYLGYISNTFTRVKEIIGAPDNPAI